MRQLCILGLIVCSFFGIDTSSAEDAKEMGGKFLFLKGEVSLHKKNDSQKIVANRDAWIEEDDVISTSAESLAVIMMNQTKIKIEANTEIHIKSFLSKEKQGLCNTIRLTLTRGGLMVEGQKVTDATAVVEIETSKNITISASSANFMTFIDDETSEVWAIVEKGKIQAYDFLRNDSESVDALKSIVIVQDDKLTLPFHYPWTLKLTWNWDPDRAVLHSQIAELRADWQREFGAKMVEVLKRKKRPFLSLPAIVQGPVNSKELAAKGNFSLIERKIKEIKSNSVYPVPEPVLKGDKAQGNALDVCNSLKGSNLACVVREGPCLQSEVSAAVMLNQVKDQIFNACVLAINGVFL